MAKVEENTPGKRKNSNKEKNIVKKGKFENGKAPSSPKQKQSSKKSQKQKQNGKDGEASSPKAKKNRNVLTKIITEAKSKQGSKDPEVVNELKQKIETITSRGEPTKTAKKKLSILKKLLLIVEEGIEAATAQSGAKEDGQKKQKAEKTAKAPAQTKKTSAPPAKKQKKKEAEEKSDSEEEDDSDAEGEEEQEEGDDSDEKVKENGDEENEDDDDDEEDKPPASKAKKTQPDLNQTKNEGKNKKRFVLFVGNIPFDTTKDDIMQHFKKVGDIVDVRIPTEKGSNRPRGFAYIEVKNNIAYEKCLSMHHTQLKGRQINVLYSQGGHKKGEEAKKQVTAKNMKLHAMRRQGKLAGSGDKATQKKWHSRNKNDSKSTGDYQ